MKLRTPRPGELASGRERGPSRRTPTRYRRPFGTADEPMMKLRLDMDFGGLVRPLSLEADGAAEAQLHLADS